MDFDTCRHQPGNQRLFDAGGIRPVVMPHGNFRFDAKLVNERAQTHAQRLYAKEVDFFFKQPPRVIFAKALRGHQGCVFVGQRIGDDIGTRRWQGHGKKQPPAGGERQSVGPVISTPKRQFHLCVCHGYCRSISLSPSS